MQGEAGAEGQWEVVVEHVRGTGGWQEKPKREHLGWMLGKRMKSQG